MIILASLDPTPKPKPQTLKALSPKPTKEVPDHRWSPNPYPQRTHTLRLFGPKDPSIEGF